jgi:hypothetical protein
LHTSPKAAGKISSAHEKWGVSLFEYVICRRSERQVLEGGILPRIVIATQTMNLLGMIDI